MDDDRGAEVPDNPEEDPDAALIALTEGDVPPGPTRRRLGRAALDAVRRTRRTAQVGLAVAALALVAAVALGVVALTDDESAPAPRAAEADAAAIVASARPATVLVQASGLGQKSFGSGVVLDLEKRLVLTNFHVISLSDEVEVGRPDKLDDAEVLAAAPCEDLALLEVDDIEGAKALPLGSQGELAQGDQVVALGYPTSASGGNSLTSTAGVVSNVRTSLRLPTPDSPRFRNLVQTDAALNPGNSGGPLVGSDGRLVGLNTAMFQGTRDTPISGQGYAVGVDRIRTVLSELREGRSMGWFGAGLLVAPPALLRRERLPDGVLATSAADGTGAAEAGLEESLITAIDGERVGNTLAGYCRAVEGVKSGERRPITAIAGFRGRPRTVSVRFE